MHRAIIPAVFILCLLTLSLDAAEPGKGYDIILNTPKDGPATIDVTGVDAARLEKVSKQDLTPERWAEVLLIHISDPNSDSSQLVILRGTCKVEGEVIRFEPRFPLVPGMSYRARFIPAKLPGSPGKENQLIVKMTMPKPDLPPPTVAQVYPSSDQLPENQLRFYLHFSNPMRQGDVYKNITLLNEAGKPIESPFLELGEELWDRAGKRLTLYIDPGRIKHGLKPREDLGPVLEKGKSFTLVISPRWTDAYGTPMKQEFRKTFRAGAPVEVGIEPKEWKLQPPTAETKDALTITFPRPLDNALSQRLIWVTNGKGETVSGKVALDEKETRWRFTPEQAWKAGEYNLVIDTSLEDVAGNGVGKPLEVDVFHPIQKRIETKTVSLPFPIDAPK